VSATSKGQETPVNRAEEGTLDALSDAVESGAGLPAVARAAARVLDASVAMIDRSGAVLAVAGASPDQEEKLLAGGERVTTVELLPGSEEAFEKALRAAQPSLHDQRQAGRSQLGRHMPETPCQAQQGHRRDGRCIDGLAGGGSVGHEPEGR